MNYTLADLLADLGSPAVPRGSCLQEMKQIAWHLYPSAEMGLVIQLTGEVEAYDLTAGEEPMLVFTARLIA